MKKRYLLFGMLLTVFAAVLTGCGSGNQTLAEYERENAESNAKETEEAAKTEEVAKTEEPEKTEEPAKTEEIKVLIYRSNDDATGFESQEVVIAACNPENIIAELAKVNIVSYDTKVLDFTVSSDEKHLVLDLSSDFSNYVNMMGSTGEYIVVGSLVNTFLEAYEAEDIQLMTEGKSLETGHTLYDKPLTVFKAEK